MLACSSLFLFAHHFHPLLPASFPPSPSLSLSNPTLSFFKRLFSSRKPIMTCKRKKPGAPKPNTKAKRVLTVVSWRTHNISICDFLSIADSEANAFSASVLPVGTKVPGAKTAHSLATAPGTAAKGHGAPAAAHNNDLNQVIVVFKANTPKSEIEAAENDITSKGKNNCLRSHTLVTYLVLQIRAVYPSLSCSSIGNQFAVCLLPRNRSGY